MLRKEEREARQVRTTLVGFGLGEVGVHGENRRQRWRDLVEQVKRGIELLVHPALRIVVDLAQCERGHRVDAESLVESLEAAQVSPIPRVEQERVLERKGPAAELVVARNPAGNVEAPGIPALREVQRLERDGDLRDPPFVVPARLCVPDAVPLLVVAARLFDEHVPAGGNRSHGERVARAPLAERVEQDHDEILVPWVGVAAHERRRDPVRLGVVAPRRKVEGVVVVQNADLRFLGQRIPLDGLVDEQLADGRAARPDLVGKVAVDGRGDSRARGTQKRAPQLVFFGSPKRRYLRRTPDGRLYLRGGCRVSACRFGCRRGAGQSRGKRGTEKAVKHTHGRNDARAEPSKCAPPVILPARRVDRRARAWPGSGRRRNAATLRSTPLMHS